MERNISSQKVYFKIVVCGNTVKIPVTNKKMIGLSCI